MNGGEVEVVDVNGDERARLLPILRDSFEGLYLWHSKRTLQSVEVVRAARTAEGVDAGLVMLKMIGDGSGYIYYVAVSPQFRNQGIGGRLVDDVISSLIERGARDVFASVPSDNAESNSLFSSRSFEKVERSEMAELYGRVRSFIMYREMMVVRGEVLLRRELAAPTKLTS
ncbi:MAG: GNAT family N-acetyltransferase [Thaumarchaeota archaeon]|nr:GNAT family N-acetyltransferase [Nitrososphaerota archaeon]